MTARRAARFSRSQIGIRTKPCSCRSTVASIPMPFTRERWWQIRTEVGPRSHEVEFEFELHFGALTPLPLRGGGQRCSPSDQIASLLRQMISILRALTDRHWFEFELDFSRVTPPWSSPGFVDTRLCRGGRVLFELGWGACQRKCGSLTSSTAALSASIWDTCQLRRRMSGACPVRRRLRRAASAIEPVACIRVSPRRALGVQ